MMRRLFPPLLCAALAVTSIGCAVKPFRVAPPDLSYTYVKGIPFLPSGPDQRDCGPESLAAIFAYRGRPTPVSEISRSLMNTDVEGTLLYEIPSYVRSKGFDLRLMHGSIADIRASIDRKSPPIVMVKLKEGVLHFFVVAGYSDEKRALSFLHYMDKGIPMWAYLPYHKFRKYWEAADNYILEIIPFSPSLEDAKRLEQMKEWDAAIKAYGKVLKSDPRSVDAQRGIGNCLYFKGDREGAAAAYEKALRVSPGDPRTVNNLAHVLRELGTDRSRALALSEKAVSDWRDAIRILESSLQSSAESEHARDTLEWMLAQRRRTLGFFLGTYGDLLHDHGRCTEAAEAYRESAGLMTDSKARTRKLEKAEACRSHPSPSR